MHYIYINYTKFSVFLPNQTHIPYSNFMFVCDFSYSMSPFLRFLVEISLWSSSSTLDGQTVESLFSRPLWSSSSSRSGRSLRALMHPLWCTAGEGEGVIWSCTGEWVSGRWVHILGRRMVYSDINSVYNRSIFVRSCVRLLILCLCAYL